MNMADEEDPHFLASVKARDACWEKLGAVDSDVIAHVINPAFMGGPRWPAMRQAFKVVRRPHGTVILASDGLSDPFDDTEGDAAETRVNGFEVEFFIETPANELPATLADMGNTWQFQLLWQISQIAADHGGFKGILDQVPMLSTEACSVDSYIPDEQRTAWVNASKRVGALLGMTEDQTAARAGYTPVPRVVNGMPLSEVRLVNIKLLALPELALAAELKAEGRERLNALFMGPDRLVSSLKRTSVI